MYKVLFLLFALCIAASVKQFDNSPITIFPGVDDFHYTQISSRVGSLDLSSNTFSEAASNDGNITQSITVSMNGGDTWRTSSGSLVLNTDYSLSGTVPTGLTFSVVFTSSSVVTLSFTGAATSHFNANDTSLTIDFKAASTTNVEQPTGHSQILAIDFMDPAFVAASTKSVQFTGLDADSQRLDCGTGFQDLLAADATIAMWVYNQDIAGNFGGESQSARMYWLERTAAGTVGIVGIIDGIFNRLNFRVADTAGGNIINVNSVNMDNTGNAWALLIFEWDVDTNKWNAFSNNVTTVGEQTQAAGTYSPYTGNLYLMGDRNTNRGNFGRLFMAGVWKGSNPNKTTLLNGGAPYNWATTNASTLKGYWQMVPGNADLDGTNTVYDLSNSGNTCNALGTLSNAGSFVVSAP